jgi:mono/diheme cytochrome c family protein
MRVITLLALWPLLFVNGCAHRGEPVSQSLRGNAGQLARGEQAFGSNCSRCHPAGKSGVGPALVTRELPGFLVLAQVRAGHGVMPAFSTSQLPADRLDDLVAYLKQLHKESVTAQH